MPNIDAVDYDGPNRFRSKAWDRDNECFSDVVAGNLICDICDDDETLSYEDRTRFTLLNSTGQVDRNRVEVFEGHVARFITGDLKGIITYSENLLRWHFVYQDIDINGKKTFESIDFLESEMSDYEVIGNIFEDWDKLESELPQPPARG